MTDPLPPQVDVPAGHFTAGLFPHALLLAALLAVPFALAYPALGGGSFLGLADDLPEFLRLSGQHSRVVVILSGVLLLFFTMSGMGTEGTGVV